MGSDGRGYYRQTYFYNDIQLYGWCNFEHKIIKDNLTAEEASKLEGLLIKKFETTNREKGYNLQSNNGKKTKRANKKLTKEITEANKEILAVELKILKAVEEKIEKRLRCFDNENGKVAIKDKYLLDINDFCEYTNVPRSTAKKIFKENNGFTIQMGNRTYVNKKFFEEYIDNCTKNNIEI